MKQLRFVELQRPTLHTEHTHLQGLYRICKMKFKENSRRFQGDLIFFKEIFKMINFCIFDSHTKKTNWNILLKEIQYIKNVLSGIYFLFPTTNYTKLKVLLYEREIYFNYIMINLTILCVHKIGIYIFHYNFPRKYLQKIIRSR